MSGNARGAERPGRLASLPILLLFLLPLAATASDQVPGARQAHPILLRGGELYTVAGPVLEGTDLLFSAGKILAIGPGLEAPADAEVIDARGQRVYPGLIAAGSSLGLVEIGAVRATRDLREVGEVTPEVAAHVAFNPDSELIPTVRAHGITTAQIVPGGDLIAGRAFLTHLDGWTKEDAGIRLVDGLVVRWPRTRVYDYFFMPPAEQQRKRMRERRQRLEEAFDAAAAYHAARAADPDLPIDLRWEAMRPVIAGEAPVYVAADDYRQIEEAVAFAAERGLRLVVTGGMDAWRLTDLLKEQDVPVIVGTVQTLPARDDEAYDQPFRLPELLHAAGVRFCLSHPGAWNQRNLPFQAAQAAAFGLPRDVALRAVTLSVAEILGIADREGSLEVGKDATLFLSRGDVLDTLGQKVTRMWIQGREVDLDSKQNELFRKYAEKIRRLGGS